MGGGRGRDPYRLCLSPTARLTASGGRPFREVGEFYARRETPVSALSDRQQEALLAAYDLGYYDHPRRATHEEICERLGCAPNTVCDHLQKAEKKVMAEVLDLAVGA